MSDKTALDFRKCTNVTYNGARWCIDCKMGLWEVESASRKDAEREAYHYFDRYKSDGEYSSIIGGKSVIQTLLESNGQ